MLLSKFTLYFFSFFSLSFISLQLKAQCNPADRSPLRVSSISTSNVTCPQNGSISILGVNGGGGGDYMYEIFSGPIIRGIQSQSIFSALLPGNYRVRVTGCNGKFYESGEITVGNNYLEPDVQTLSFISAQSFKCNTTNNGKVLVNVNLRLPNNLFLDSQLYKLPFRYQVSTNGDPSTGFASSPYFDLVNTSIKTRIGDGMTLRTMQKFDTIVGLNPGTTYFVRVTDGCGVFKTVSIRTPAISNTSYSYAFQVKEPYILSTSSTDYPGVKGSCIQWGELSILSAGSPISSIAAANTFMPITAVLKRQDDGSIINSRIFQSGGLSKFSYAYSNPNTNNLLFDSIPRVPVVLEITDQCGTVTTINVDVPSTKVPFKVQAFSSCGSYPYFYINTINAAASLPVKLKIYDASNTLLVNKTMNVNYQHVNLPNTAPILCCDQQSFVPSFGEYRIVYADQCGISDSIVFNFAPGTAPAPTPAFAFNPYQAACSSGDGIERFIVDPVQTVSAPVSKIEIISGPAGLSYPRLVKKKGVTTMISSGSYITNNHPFFDSLIAGTYQVKVQYGCNQIMYVDFTITGGAPVNITGNLSFSLLSNVCSAVGSTVNGTANITSTDVNFIISDFPQVRIINAPIEFLQSISRSKDGSEPVLPFNLGAMNASSFLNNDIDTTLVNVYPLFGFPAMIGGSFSFPAGNYTFQLYGKCSENILDTKSFTVTDGGYSKPNLGASAAFLCDGGDVKVVASPIGGRRNFLYQMKLATDPNDANYTALQADSIFNLPSTVVPGTVYTIRTVDACNNSFVGQVVVNSFTGTLYISASNDCLGAPSRIITGFIPGAIYTWTKPDGTTIITNSNELNIANFAIADIGTYTVQANALGGCISKSATATIGTNCYGVLPVSILSFSAQKINQSDVALQWKTAAEINMHHYEIERSTDGINWVKIAMVPATASASTASAEYEYKDYSVSKNNSTLMYYRIKSVDNTSKINYTAIKKVYFSTAFALLKVYPTPFVSSVAIDFMSESTASAIVSLYDMSGKEVSKSVMPVIKGINHYQYAPVLPISNGTYLLTLTQGNNRFTTKVIKGQ
jgi:hypothetical protein